MTGTNSKDYRDTVLKYREKLAEVDKLEDELVECKKEASELKKIIDNHKRRNK